MEALAQRSKEKSMCKKIADCVQKKMIMTANELRSRAATGYGRVAGNDQLLPLRMLP